MEKWDWQRMDHNLHEAKHLKSDHSHHHNHRSRHPSFSSALLDAICKSTEDVEGGFSSSREETSRLQKNTKNNMLRNSSVKRAARLEPATQGGQANEEHWTTDPAGKDSRRRSAEMSASDAEKCFARHEIESLGGSSTTAAAEDLEAAAHNKQRTFQLFFQSISSCSSEASDNTSSNWPYSSSDAESLYRPAGKYSAKTAKNSEKTRKWASCMARGREWSEEFHGRSSVKDRGFRSEEPSAPESKPKSKIRKDSKKPKQPISPGSKLANFLNSLFTAGGTKKAKLSSSSSVSESNSYYSSQRKPASSACSSSSSVHRSCLTSSRGKTGNGVRRSVTFYPTSMIVDDFSRPACGHMENRTPHPNQPDPLLSEKLKLHLLEKDSQASTAKNILARYQKANSILEAVARELDNQDEEDDDDASCSSSDLFELENLAASDLSMYHKELPVYGTTHLETNKAIAKGLIV